MKPVLFHIGPLAVYTYGVLTAAAVALSAGLAARRSRAFGYPPGLAIDAVFVLFVSGMAGARLFFVLQHLDAYRAAPMRALDFREGGLVWYGGFFAAVAAGFALAGRFGNKRWVFADFLAPLAAAGHAVGRIGCWFNGCCYGFPGLPPVQAIEAAYLAVLSAILWKRSGRGRDGDTFLLYVVLYAAGRFVIEFWRADQTRWGPFSLPQFISAVLFAAGAGVWMVRHRAARSV